ncbi:MAG: hypothetical protein LBH44_07515 [Treponema sp.]|nr:hypothetical protein [Treponema sp.]
MHHDWKCRNALQPLNMAYENLSRKHGVSVSSVKRYIGYIDTNGYQPKQTAMRPLVAWDNEALNFFKMFFLKVTREAGRCTVRNAYKQTALMAAQNGWKIGSEQSAYVHAREAIHPMLKLYVKGGSRALDNLFYIARDLSSLRPFQIVVGDQHRFDFWVTDENGVYFRPECYLWLDMRTRLPYGIWAIDPRTNEAIPLTPVTPIPMLDEKATSAAIEQKRGNMKAVTGAYNTMTSGAQMLFDPDKFRELREAKAAAANLPTTRNETSSLPAPESPAMTPEEFSAAIAAKITVEPNIRERSKLVYLTPRDRYESLRIALGNNQKISAADLAFMAEYEEGMDDEEEAYFASQFRLNKPKGVLA